MVPGKQVSNAMLWRVGNFAGCLMLGFSSGFAGAQAGSAAQGDVTLQIKVDRVLIPVVVRDKQGHVVTDLKEEDFQVLDNDKAHAISAFRIEKREGAAPEAGANTAAEQAGVAAGGGNATPSALPKRIVVLLFDDMHLSATDLAYSKKAAASALDAALEDSGMAAVVTISGRVNSGITRDRDPLLKALNGIQPLGIAHNDAAECPKVTYYQADLIENKHDSSAIADVVAQVFRCDPGLDPARDYNMALNEAEAASRRALSLGGQDVRSTFATVKEFVRRIAPMPGQRTLVLRFLRISECGAGSDDGGAADCGDGGAVGRGDQLAGWAGSLQQRTERERTLPRGKPAG